MIRISALVWVVVLALLGIGLFQVKYNVQTKERELRDVHRRIEANLAAIHVLEAEWSYLNDPLRLADLARRHTGLAPTTPSQIGDIATLHARIEDAPAAPEAPESTPSQPPLVSDAPQAPAGQPAAPVVQIKAETPADQQTAAASEQQVQQEPKPLKPKDEQAEADAMIDAILADMEKAQIQPAADGGAQ
ncbi:MAG: cell division protein FtsL [Dongiaceae bacterium]